MELREFIEIGAIKAGSQLELGKMLGINQPNMSEAKRHKRPLPADAVMKLADYIEEDVRKIIAANELVTEKKEEKIRYWNLIMRSASSVTAALLLCVTLIVTPTPAEASSIKAYSPEEQSSNLYYVK